MPFADSQGCRIYYRLEGAATKPLLVLVHSLGADHGMWDAQMPALLRHFQVLRLDLRGHGASDVPAGDYTIEQLARDVLHVVPRPKIQPVAHEVQMPRVQVGPDRPQNGQRRCHACRLEMRTPSAISGRPPLKCGFPRIKRAAYDSMVSAWSRPFVC